jgi:hypothetical protein
MSERDLQRAIVATLRRAGVWVRANVVSDRGRFKRTGLGVGSADLLCVVPPHGRAVFLEVKTRVGKASDEQVEFVEEVQRFGAIARVVRSVEEAVSAVTDARVRGL